MKFGLLTPGHQGGGVLGIFVPRDVSTLRVRFSPMFSRTGCQTREIFLEPVVKTSQKGTFCWIRLLSFPILALSSIPLTEFSGNTPVEI